MSIPTLFEGARMTLDDSKALTVESLNHYFALHEHIAVAFSGGKDSTAVVTLLAYLIKTGAIKKPKSIIVLYADTRMEIPPLHASAMAILDQLKEIGIEVEIVYPAMDDRFFVYMLGRGVPPPSNTFRWCTSQLKIEPMQHSLEKRAVRLGMGKMIWSTRWQKFIYEGFGKEKLLLITGVRLGESAARDERIVVSCSKDDSECGQGWFQQSAREGLYDTLAPLLHWRVCLVWDWLMGFVESHGFNTKMVAEVYGIYEDGSDAELGTRTGCIECNLASKDTALDNLLKIDYWAYLAPLKRLKIIYAEMKEPQNRHRKNGERNKDGKLAKNQGRLGPLTLEARIYFLGEILKVQNEINSFAEANNRPKVVLINAEEKARILELIAAKTYPDKWTGAEMRGDEMKDVILRDGTIQPVMFGE